MYQIKADPARQKFYLTIHGKIEAADAPQIIAQTRQALAKLKPHYTAAIDLEGLTVINPVLNDLLKEMQNILIQAQPGKIGTLLNSSVLKLQISTIGQQTGINRIAQRFDNKTEWEKFLGL